MPADRNSDLFAAAMWAVAAFIAVTLTHSVPVRLILAVPLVLFVPGHVLLRALGLNAASLAAQCTYAVGASIAVTLVGGLALNLVSGLTPLGWAGWFAVFTLALCCVASRRSGDANWTLALPRPGVAHGAMLGGALLIGCAAYAVSVHGEALQHQFRYTEFWMVRASPDDPGRLLIGIKSAEQTPQLFDVGVSLDGRPAGFWRSVAVKPGGTWLVSLDVAPGAGKSQKAEATLYRPGGNEIYRRVSAVVPGR